MRIRIILKCFEKCKSLGTALFIQSSRYVSNEQSHLKTPGLYGKLLLVPSLFHIFYFIISAPISFSLCSPIFPSILFVFFNALSQVFVECSRKSFA